MAKQIVAGELYESITGQLFEIGRQLRQKNGYPYDAEALKKHLQGAIEGRFAEGGSNSRNEFVRLISNDEALILGATDGKEVLADAKDVFAYIDSAFRLWGTDAPGPTTKEMPVQVYELVKDATFAQMFGSISTDPNKLCLTQAQIKDFVKGHRRWLQTDGYATFFLFKSHEHFFVACVYVRVYSGGELRVRVLRFERDDVRYAVYRRRVVVPQLA